MKWLVSAIAIGAITPGVLSVYACGNCDGMAVGRIPVFVSDPSGLPLTRFTVTFEASAGDDVHSVTATCPDGAASVGSFRVECEEQDGEARIGLSAAVSDPVLRVRAEGYSETSLRPPLQTLEVCGNEASDGDPTSVTLAPL